MKLIPGVFLQDKNILVNTLFTFFKCISKISHRISKFKGASNESISALKKAFRRRPFKKFCINNKTLNRFVYTKVQPFCKDKS